MTIQLIDTWTLIITTKTEVVVAPGYPTKDAALDAVAEPANEVLSYMIVKLTPKGYVNDA